MAGVAEAIRAKLEGALKPASLEVVDDSHRHAGHAGASAGGESHFTVRITSEAFRGEGRLARQRRVYALLRDELAGSVHALSVQATAPGE